MMDLNTTPRSINPMQQLSAISIHRPSVQLIRTILRGEKEKQSQDRYMSVEAISNRTRPNQNNNFRYTYPSIKKNNTDTPTILDTFPPTPYPTTDKKEYIYIILPPNSKNKAK